MTKKDIEKFTRKAGGFDATPEFLERFTSLVVSAEREACAKVCDETMREHDPFDRQAYTARTCAEYIRARGIHD